MGQKTRAKPARLSEKLLQIREGLGLSQNGLLRHLELSDQFSQGDVSEWERERREPSLLVLLKYARGAGVSMDVLVDDELDLPKRLPATARKSSKRN